MPKKKRRATDKNSSAIHTKGSGLESDPVHFTDKLGGSKKPPTIDLTKNMSKRLAQDTPSSSSSPSALEGGDAFVQGALDALRKGMEKKTHMLNEMRKLEREREEKQRENFLKKAESYKDDMYGGLDIVKERIREGYLKEMKQMTVEFYGDKPELLKILSYWANERFKLDESWSPVKKMIDSVQHFEWE